MRASPYILSLAVSLLIVGCSFDPPARPSVPSDASRDADVNLDVLPDGAPKKDEPKDVRVDPVPDVVPDLQPDIRPDLNDEEPDVYVPNMALCEEIQVDLNQDPQNCGGCGVACDPTYGACNNGVCGCAPSGMKACLADRKCEDTQISPLHCGDCDTACVAGAWCNGGACECRPGFTMCDGQCVDQSVDPAHCGECGLSCGGNACRQGSCRSNDRCPFYEGQCNVNDEDGAACLSENDFDSPLYCREDLFPDRCGRRCRSDQICVKPGFFSPRKCFNIRPALGCTSCRDCDSCDSNEVCNDDWSPANTAYCMKK